LNRSLLQEEKQENTNGKAREQQRARYPPK
jgi:hypothetical protein